MILSNVMFHPTGDDYIGTESCNDLQNENEVVDNYDTSKYNDDVSPENQTMAKSNIRKKEKRVFPPPIPLLAQTQNLASHMPWVLKRYYTSEGRLILKEEKVRHHEYFRAHRANGRLTLHLVPLDDCDECFETSEGQVAPPTTPREEIDDNNVTHDESLINNNRFEDEENVASSIAADEPSVENDNGVVVAGGNGRAKCLNCISVRSAPSCIFEVPVHSIRTVQG